MGYLVAPAQKPRLYPAQPTAQLYGHHELNTRLDGLGPAFLAGVFIVPVCSSWDFVSTSIHVHFMTPPSSYAVPDRLDGLLGGTSAEIPTVSCPAGSAVVGTSRFEHTVVGLSPAFLAGVFIVPTCFSWCFKTTPLRVQSMTPPSSYAVPGRLFGLLGGTGAETPAVPCPASRGIVGASRIERPAG
jgi:hypothetical protein